MFDLSSLSAPEIDSLFPSWPILRQKSADLWIPPTRLPLSTWSEENITLSSEYAARSSKLRLFGWQREIFDAFTDPAVEDIVLCVGTQLTKTLLLQCAIAYVICEDPGPILLVEPKDPDAKAFSKERLTPMLRDCSCLHSRVAASAQEGNTMLTKEFPGGSLSIVGAIAPGNLARRSIRYLFCDEVDKYPVSAGKEGDPIKLAWERTATFGSRRKRIICCSPTEAGTSRIDKAYQATDMRRPYVSCPACGFSQILRWSQVKDVTGGSFSYNGGKTARYECANRDCLAKWTDIQRWAACDKAEWRAEKPFTGRAGFWINHLYAPWQSKKLSILASEFLLAHKDPNQLKTFVNTNLAEVWVNAGEVTDPEVLYARRESYPFGPDAVIPSRGLFLTAAVDVQDNPPRLEVEVVAWGRGRESWSIDYRVIQSFADNGQALPVSSPELWALLDAEILQHQYRHASGQMLSIMAIGIDTGNRPKPVYEFARKHQQASSGPAGSKVIAYRTVVPVKGTPDPLRILGTFSKEDQARKRQGVKILTVGTHCAKQELYDCLKAFKPNEFDQPVPGLHHFPMYELAYFQGLCSEVRVVRESGKVEYEKRVERNEPLDLKIYGRAMAALIGIDRFTENEWQRLEAMVKVTVGVSVNLPPMQEKVKVVVPSAAQSQSNALTTSPSVSPSIGTATAPQRYVRRGWL